MLENIDPAYIEELQNCKTPEDILALAKRAGYKLSEAELDAVSGGGWDAKDVLAKCPSCGSYAVAMVSVPFTGTQSCKCSECGWSWINTPVS